VEEHFIMTKAMHPRLCLDSTTFHRTTAALAVITIIVAVVIGAPVVWAQSYSVLHNFTGGADGGVPQVGLTMDAAGNFYGTTYNGGNPACTNGCGVVFRLTHAGSGWVLNPMYAFAGGADGANPHSRVTIAADGTLYGATYNGGGTGCSGGGCGTIFHLTPPRTAPRTALYRWDETVIYRFTGGSDGANPQGDLTLDAQGNLYGTALLGGSSSCPYGGCGAVYELAQSGSTWTQSVLYSPQYDGPFAPMGGVVFDHSGNLYGVFQFGPGSYNGGAVYELSPSGSGWTEQNLYVFTCGQDGCEPVGGLIFDSSGKLWGTTASGGDPTQANGTAFELWYVNGRWNFDAFYIFPGGPYFGPSDKLMIDSAGNLYGTSVGSWSGRGTVYELSDSNGSWTETYPHNFSGSDGAAPMSIVTADRNGNFYGTASQGGSSGSGCGGSGCGVIWKITP
jgi:uncharacterized repeat protein (TIGR03803 family)